MNNIKYIILCLILLIASSCQTDVKQAADSEQKQEEKPGNKLDELSVQIEQDTTNAVLYFDRANAYLAERDVSSAADDVLKAMELDPKNSKYYQLASEILLKINDSESAINMLKRGLHIKPFNIPMRLEIAKLYLITKDYKSCEKNLNTVLNFDESNATAYFYKGMLSKEQSQPADMIEHFKKAVQLDPDNLESHMQLGLNYSSQNNPIAIAHFDNVIRIDETSLEAYYAKALFYQKNNDFPEAKKIYKQINANFPPYYNSLYNIGWMLFQEDSVELAQKHFNMAVKAAPSFSNGYHMRGLCSEVLGEKEKAIADYEQCLVFKEDHTQALEGLKRLGK